MNAKLLIGLGIALVVAGLIWMLAARMGFGRLPGDIVVRRERVTFYFPLATCLILSLVASVIFWLLGRFGR